jgi:hypothetical protein
VGMSGKIERIIITRRAKCRLCEKPIDKGTQCLVLEFNARNIGEVFFHESCLISEVEKLIPGFVDRNPGTV